MGHSRVPAPPDSRTGVISPTDCCDEEDLEPISSILRMIADPPGTCHRPAGLRMSGSEPAWIRPPARAHPIPRSRRQGLAEFRILVADIVEARIDAPQGE